jgi:hypothetical protein
LASVDELEPAVSDLDSVVPSDLPFESDLDSPAGVDELLALRESVA